MSWYVVIKPESWGDWKVGTENIDEPKVFSVEEVKGWRPRAVAEDVTFAGARSPCRAIPFPQEVPTPFRSYPP